MKVGDRVRYIPAVDDREGTVVEEINHNTVRVRFDSGSQCWVHTKNLEIIMLDLNKPLAVRVSDRSSVADRPVTVIAKTDDGGVLVSGPNPNDWMLFNADGSYNSSNDGRGSALRLVNHDVQGEAFIVIGTQAWGGGDGQIHKTDPKSPVAAHSIIRLITTNGFVTGVELVRGGTGAPIKL